MEYTSNSHRSKETPKAKPEEKKVVQKVVTGTVKTKKKNELTKLADIFLPEDVQDVKSYVLMDVLIPAAKKLIDDVVTGGVHMWLYGSAGRSKSSGSGTSYVSYRNYSDPRDSRPRAEARSSRYSYDDIVLESRGDAELVISQMDEMMETYGNVSVADLYDLVGKSCDYTDNRYGWTNIRNAEPVRVRDGWMIKMPRAIPLK